MPYPRPARLVGFAMENPPTAANGLYEFQDETGSWIRLHDAICTAITYRPGGPPSLVIDFVFDHPDWVPDGLRHGGVVRLRFDRAVVTAWLNDGAEPDADNIPGGQISDLSWDGEARFMVSLLSNSIYFTATSVTLEKPS